jgi:hypothetical protein
MYIVRKKANNKIGFNAAPLQEPGGWSKVTEARGDRVYFNHGYAAVKAFR